MAAIYYVKNGATKSCQLYTTSQSSNGNFCAYKGGTTLYAGLVETTATNASDLRVYHNSKIWAVANQSEMSPELTLSSYDYTVTGNNKSTTITATYNGSGTLSATTTNSSVATVSVSNKKITISSKGIGTCSINVALTASAPYVADATSIRVRVKGTAGLTISPSSHSGGTTGTGVTITVKWTGDGQLTCYIVDNYKAFGTPAVYWYDIDEDGQTTASYQSRLFYGAGVGKQNSITVAPRFYIGLAGHSTPYVHFRLDATSNYDGEDTDFRFY